jgi:nitronate monooxygenase
MTVEQLRVAAADVVAGTNGTVNFNFFVHEEPDLAKHAAGPMHEALKQYYAEFGLGEPVAPRAGAPSFNDEMLEALLACAPKVVSFHFGLPKPHAIEALKRTGAKLIGNATNVAEAKALEAGGMDAVVAQGAEAGGHRGAFVGAPHENDMGTMALVPLVVDAVRVPVIAAGGIFDGRGVAAAMMLGASGAQIGSAFLRSPECMVPELHKQALAETPDNATKLTRLFSGRPARSIRNRLVRELAAHEGDAAPFPTQRAVIAPLAKAAAERGSADFMQLWSGQAGLRAGAAPSAQIFKRICDEALALLR